MSRGKIKKICAGFVNASQRLKGLLSIEMILFDHHAAIRKATVTPIFSNRRQRNYSQYETIQTHGRPSLAGGGKIGANAIGASFLPHVMAYICPML
ncbi:MAG: hypothetical protein RRY35_05995, partial [Clostridiales bacterium]